VDTRLWLNVFHPTEILNDQVNWHHSLSDLVDFSRQCQAITSANQSETTTDSKESVDLLIGLMTESERI
jgi:hypothetical protein